MDNSLQSKVLFFKAWLINLICIILYLYLKHTAEANPMAANKRPFSRGASLKYSIAITEPIECISITGRKPIICNTNGNRTSGLLNSSKVLVTPDLFTCSESIEENKKRTIKCFLENNTDIEALQHILLSLDGKLQFLFPYWVLPCSIY